MNHYHYFKTVPVDEFGNPVIRTKQEYQYSYDGFITYRNGENSEANSTIYSDRLSQWNYAKKQELMLKHFGKNSDYWDSFSPEKVQDFLRDWTEDKGLKLIFIMEYCNVSNGYPLWRFDYKRSQE